ncbi:MAG: hypothetical protein KGH57_01040 [Candidatus Micrarchaeota archaeon]|nr:hypothetical protein [Candidatus Micrarchaeota archaeon]
MAKQIPWDEQTDSFISDLEDTISKAYSVSLRGLLTDPTKYLSKENFSTTLQGIRSQINSYFDALLENMKEEQAKLASEMESATAQYKAIDSVINSKAAVARVPYIKPLLVSRTASREESIVIESYDESLEAFIGKLVNVSTYVADMSADYKQYKLGSWIFSGAKNHVLTVNPPTSPVLVIENSKGIIDDMLDNIESRAAK